MWQYPCLSIYLFSNRVIQTITVKHLHNVFDTNLIVLFLLLLIQLAPTSTINPVLESVFRNKYKYLFSINNTPPYQNDNMHKT
jgi:hypothetical protein